MSNNITGHTRLACVLGSPVSHSISPAMHNMAFNLLDIDCSYLAFDVKLEELPEVVNAFRKMNVLGFNLTMPHKTLMCSLCDELSDAARISGAVNTVVNDNGKFIGYTTDGIGFMMACEDAGFHPVGKKMVLLGAGGAAAAILVQAALDGVSEISVFNRPGASYDNIAKIMEQLKNETSCRLKLFTYDDPSVLKNELSDAYILVNASSVGMAPNSDASLITDPSFFHKDLCLYDIIYNPEETKLMSIAKAAGCKVANGKLMLLYQGAAAFKKWTGKDMPVQDVKNKLFS